MENNEIKRRKVMIGTPCYDGKLEAYYVNSLINTIKMSYEKNVDILSIWVSYDALVQRARNDTVAIALELGCDDLIFIDADIEWDPSWFFKLLDYNEDVVGGIYPKKTDIQEEYPVYNESQNWQPQSNGLIEVSGLGTGFLKLSKNALQYLWDNNEEYFDQSRPEVLKKMIFNVNIRNKFLVSEDISACLQLKQGGFKIWLDPSMTCAHIGNKKYVSNFSDYLQRLLNINTNIPPPNFDDDTII